ncbi:hypothetical protein PoB_001844400 [Plakobranchus ocellatus]|uniref:Uncharacterized protein n=1 Tax=Plakobranchus ocellatus TaxID=259542 RepID=A0AAV3ZC39_9GAST|nr:hypothetical protein PoB_001844400 [Plakobranchus ocellatus]
MSAIPCENLNKASGSNPKEIQLQVHIKVISGFQALMSSQGTGGGARTNDRSVSEDLRADLLSTVPPSDYVDVFLQLSS